MEVSGSNLWRGSATKMEDLKYLSYPFRFTPVPMENLLQTYLSIEMGTTMALVQSTGPWLLIGGLLVEF